jgi:hypothetical protein
VNDNALRQALERIERRNAEQAKEIAALREKFGAIDLTPLKLAAARSPYTYESLRLWAIKGVIKARRIGGKWFVDRRALEEHLRCKKPRRRPAA